MGFIRIIDAANYGNCQVLLEWYHAKLGEIAIRRLRANIPSKEVMLALKISIRTHGYLLTLNPVVKCKCPSNTIPPQNYLSSTYTQGYYKINEVSKIY